MGYRVPYSGYRSRTCEQGINSTLPLVLNELAISLIARDWTAQFVWWAHRRIAEEEGLPFALVQAISNQTPIPKSLPDEVMAVFEFCTEIIQTRKVGYSTFKQMQNILVSTVLLISWQL